MRCLRRYLKEMCIIIALGLFFSWCLWHDADVGPVLLISNILALLSLIFLMVGIAEYIMDNQGNSFTSYGKKRYVTPDRSGIYRDESLDKPTGEQQCSYVRFLPAIKELEAVHFSFLFSVLFMASSVLFWFLFRNLV